MPSGDSSVFDIFFVGVLQVHDARADRGEGRLRDDERVAEAVVEPDRDVARQLDVLALVVADGDLVGVVEEDVGGHQHRVVEEADARPNSWPSDFSLNCVIRRSSPNDAMQLRIHVSSEWARTWLWTNSRRAVGIEAGGHQQHRHAPGAARSARPGRRAR